ncbi:MAG TPA: hypothetical protein PK156_44020, partial [Polyangium sp.]|nr:hypothetical protein [Polyangium sp.]
TPTSSRPCFSRALSRSIDFNGKAGFHFKQVFFQALPSARASDRDGPEIPLLGHEPNLGTIAALTVATAFGMRREIIGAMR